MLLAAIVLYKSKGQFVYDRGNFLAIIPVRHNFVDTYQLGLVG